MKNTLRALSFSGLIGFAACGGAPSETPSPNETGYLVVGLAGEPQTWNHLMVVDTDSYPITKRIHASLLRVNQQTQEVEPELAESWFFSEDGTELTFVLRTGVFFSDGHPLRAEDVVFTFRALHDPDVGCPLTETAKIQGEPLFAEAVDERTVRFRLPRRTAVVERVFDSISILPRHILEPALEDGSFVSAYGVGAPADGIVGSGPFMLQRYVPGQRVILGRNPHYWKRGSRGETLPLLDGIVFEIVPDGNARLLKFAAGEIDLLGGISPEDFVGLRDKPQPHLKLRDLGPGMLVQRLWFNLNPNSPAVSEEERQWFSDPRFRRAISLAVDRLSIVQGVYQGLAAPALGAVSSANRKWRNEAIEAPQLDLTKARRLLSESGFRWSNSGELVDGKGNTVRFTLVTDAGNRYRERAATFIQEDMAKLGIEMALAPLDRSDLIGRIVRSFDYQACYYGVTLTDPDPSAEAPMWLSRASLHFWNPSQEHPATDWEARIDQLMEQQMLALNTAERKSLYDEVQFILATQVPLVEIVVPHVIVGVSNRVENLEPTPYMTPPLWNSEVLSLAR